MRFFSTVFSTFLGVLFALLAHSYIEARAAEHAFSEAMQQVQKLFGGMGQGPMLDRRSGDTQRVEVRGSGECPQGYGRGVIESYRDGKPQRQVICVAPISQ